MIEEIDMSQHRPQLKKVLVLGDYGSGKTHFIGTFPKPIALFNFDRGFDTVAMTPGIKVFNIQEKDRKSPAAWTDFRQRFVKWLQGEEYVWPDGRRERYRTGAIDSLTFLSEYCMNQYQYLGSNVDKKATYTQYQQILENMTDVLNDCRRAAEYFVCSALTKIEKDELTGEVLSLPNMTGSIRDLVGAKFDAVFYLYADKKTNGDEVFKLKTVGGYREKAKIRLPSNIRDVIAPTIEDPNFEKILKIIDAKIAEVYGATAAAQPVQTVQPPAEVKTVQESGPTPPRTEQPKPGTPTLPKPGDTVVGGPAGGTKIVSPAPTPVVQIQVKPAGPTASVPPVAKPAPAIFVPKPNVGGVKIQPRVRP